MPDDSLSFDAPDTTKPERASDADLLASLRLQSRQALEILYDRYAGIVMALGVRIVRDREAAGEIAEAVFSDLCRDPDRFTGPLADRLLSHARTIAIQRRRSAKPTIHPVMADASRPDPVDNPAEPPNLRWQRVRTQRALARLSNDSRQIVEMVCLDALDVVEVAHRLNLAPADVRQRFAVGMGALRDALRIAPIAANAFDPNRFPLVSLDRVRVLVVDDEPDARRTLTRALQTLGAFVTAAASVAEAMALLPHTNPEVLVSDLAMPDEDGFDLIRKVRRAGRTVRDLPAIAVTAFADRQTRCDAMLAGFQTHVAKPIDPHELAEVVASLTGRTGAM